MLSRRIVKGIVLLLFVALLASCAPADVPTTPDGGESVVPGAATPGQVADEGERAMGRYVEEEIPLQEDVDPLDIFRMIDGVLYRLSVDGTQLYTSTDYATWQSEATGFTEVPDPETGFISDFAVDDGGDLYILYTLGFFTADSDFRSESYVARCSGGAATKLSFAVDGVGVEYTNDAGETYRDLGARHIAVLPSGEIMLVRASADAYVFGPEMGEEVHNQLSVSGVETFAQYGNELAFYLYEERAVRVFDGTTGEILRDIPVQVGDSGILLQYDSQGALYYATSEGIFRCVPGGTLWECLVDGALSVYSQPSMWQSRLFLSALDEPMVLSAEVASGAPHLYGFRYDPNVPTEPATELTLYALQDSEYLRQCAALFQSQFPEVMVRFDIALTEGSAITRDDAIRALNLEVLGGQGPDLILLDGLPTQSYVEKGVLADMSDFLIPMTQDGTLLPNIATAFQQEGSLPAVPLRFSMPTLWGDGVADMTTLEDVTAWAAANPTMRPIYRMTPRDLVDIFILSCAPAWYDERGLLRQDAVEAFLTALGSLHAPWASEEIPAYLQEMEGKRPVEEGEWDPYGGGWSGIGDDLNGLVDFAYNDLGMIAPMIGGLNIGEAIFGAMTQRGHGDFATLPGQAERAFFPTGVIGINAQSENLDAAKEFVRFALGEQLQGVNTGDGFPVHSGALEARVENKGGVGDITVGDDTGRVTESAPLDDAATARFRRLIDSLATPIIPDVQLHTIVMEESAAFFAGEMEAAQAAQNIVERANAYLSE